MNDVFLSYTGKESDYAEQLYDDLSRYGASVWFDKKSMPSDHGGDGHEIRQILRKAIQESRGLLLLVSGRSSASRWVRYELESLIALENKRMTRRIVALLIGPGSERDIPAGLESPKIHDLRDHFRPRYQRARESIFRDLLSDFDLPHYRRVFDNTRPVYR